MRSFMQVILKWHNVVTESRCSCWLFERGSRLILAPPSRRLISTSMATLTLAFFRNLPRNIEANRTGCSIRPPDFFVENEFTRTLSENCLGTAWHGGCWKANWIDFDPKKHEIRVRYFIGLGECGPPVDRYRVENNRLINVHREVLDMDSNGCTITISDLASDTMRLTTVRRFDARGRPRQ